MANMIQAVIPVQKKRKRLETILKALAGQTVPVSRVILVSTIGSGDVLEGIQVPESLFAECVTSAGSSKGSLVNKGICAADSEFVLVLDPQVIIEDKELISRLLNGMREESTVLSAARCLEDPERNTVSNALTRYMNPEQSYDHHKDVLFRYGVESYIIPQGAVLYRKSAFDEIGLFDPESISDPAYVWIADAIFAGKNLHYEASACVSYAEKQSFTKSVGKAFDFGAAQKIYVQSFGLNLNMYYWETNNHKYEIIVRTMKHFYKDQYKEAARYACKKGRFYLIPYLWLLKACNRTVNGLGKRYHRIPKTMVKFFSGTPDYWKVV